MMKKICAAVLAACIFISVQVSADVIWQNEESRVITKGIVHRYVEKFTDSGWEKINILEVDLSDKNLSLTTLYDSNGIKNLKSVPVLAKEAGVAAAVNADFFNFTPSSPLGFTVEAGEIISSPSHDTGLAAFMENKDGNVFMDYFQMSLFAVAPDGDRAQIIHINKYHSMQSIVMFTRGWGTTSPGSQNGAVELVAENGRVTEIRENLPGATIPENGFVLATSPEVNTFFKDNFAPGDEIKIELSITPDYGEAQTAVGGGTVLVSQGEIFTFTNNVSGSHPRTAAGIDKESDTLYLVTVDGRQTATAGMTQTQLAQLMIDIGAYNAINFDGGGSTTMVAQNREEQLETVNVPSGGSLRSVSTALGVIENHPAGELAGFDVALSSQTVFKGDSIDVWVTPYDTYYNKYTMGDEKIQYTSSGGGEFDGYRYYPAAAGEDTIMVIAEGAKGSAKLCVLENAVQMTVSPQTASLTAGQSQSISVTAKDKNGFESYVSPQKIKWTTESGNVEIKDGQITSVDGGNAVVKLTVDDAEGYVLINSFKTEEKQIYDFSGADSFASYPSYVGGSYEKGVLTYDFTSENTENTKAAYMVFDNEISLKNIISIGLNVTAEKENPHWLRGQIDMPDGSVQRITFAPVVDWTGTKYVEAVLSPELQSGILTRIYLVQRDNTQCDSGSIRLDGLTVQEVSQQGSEYLNDSYADEMSGQVNKISYAVFPALLQEKTMMDIHMNKQIKGSMNTQGQWSSNGRYAYMGIGRKGFEWSEQGEGAFITIDNSNGGIRATDSTQWHRLMEAVKGTSADNVFIMLEEDYVFTDAGEQELFENTLTKQLFEKGKNVFVIYPSAAPSVTLRNGVRYMAVTKTPRVRAQNFAEDLKSAVYLSFEMTGGQIIYQFKPLAGWNI